MVLCGMHKICGIVLAIWAGAVIGQEVIEYQLQFPLERPSSAKLIPGDLCGFSIEADRFPHWAGNVSHKNEFTYNLMNNLREKAGIAPHIRVGGGSQDHVISTPDVTEEPGFYNVFDPVPDVPRNTKSLFPQAYFTGAGFNYWLCAGNFPKGTKFSWGVNFVVTNISETLAQVTQLEKAFAHPHCRDVELYAVELGNEADSWSDGERRPENWTIWDYKKEQTESFNAITKALGPKKRKFRTADWAKYWNSIDLHGTGIMESEMGRSINVISEHHYQGNKDMSLWSPTTWPGIASDLTNKYYIRGNVSRYTIGADLARNAGVQFVLGETGSYFGHGQPGVSNSAAAALWMIDYSLQAAVNGVNGLHFHQGVGYNYSAFQPLDYIGINITDFNPKARRHVMPLYYGYLAVADAIGPSGNTYINEIYTGRSGLAAYQLWEGRQLKRLMLINSAPWTSASEGDRQLVAITLADLGVNQRASFKRLDLPSLSVTSGLKWGGQSWETYSGIPTGKETFETLESDGRLYLNGSSAALVYLQ